MTVKDIDEFLKKLDDFNKENHSGSALHILAVLGSLEKLKTFIQTMKESSNCHEKN